MSRNKGHYLIFGDFNVVRSRVERMACNFSQRKADDFNSFICDNDLLEIPLGGFSFTLVPIVRNLVN